MNKKKLIILIFGLVLALGLTTTGILAWLTDTKTTTDVTFKVGEVKYIWQQGATKQTPVVPGENVITTPFGLSNESTVKSELRMVISIKDSNNVDVSDEVILTLSTGWILDNGYYYYRVGEAQDGKYPILVETTNISVLTGMALNGAVVGNDHVNKVYTVSISFQAKQADYVTWENLGSINFTTGL